MKINQVYSIVNSVAKQVYGSDFVKVTDLRGLIQLGESTLASDTNKDNFLNTLVDRIGRTIISQRAYSAGVKSLMNDAFTFGAIMQKIYIDPLPAAESKTWALNDGTSVDQYIISKPTVRQKLFADRNTWQVNITIPDIQLQSAFTNATEMAVFIDAIFLSMRNSMEIYLEGMANMCYANFIGCRIVDTKLNNGHTAIDLLAEYNSLNSTSMTTAQAMVSLDFLKFATTQINLYIKRMAKMSTLYNSEGYTRFTPKERLRVTMLADFTSACDSYLQAPTYHNELVSLPNYNEVTYWQGIITDGGKRGIEATGAVNIATSNGYTVKQNNIIAVLSDEEAIGLTYDNRRSKAVYNANGEYTNYFEKADVGYFNDLSENGIIFIVGELATPTIASAVNIENTFSKAAAADIIVNTSNSSAQSSNLTSGGATLVKDTDYTSVYTSGTKSEIITLKTAYISALDIGQHVFHINYADGSLLEFYITITA